MTMPYYDGKRLKFTVNGEVRYMTEESAEEYQQKFPLADVQSATDLPDPLPDEAADEMFECSCPDDPPNANQTTTLCTSCRAYFASLED